MHLNQKAEAKIQAEREKMKQQQEQTELKPNQRKDSSNKKELNTSSANVENMKHTPSTTKSYLSLKSGKPKDLRAPGAMQRQNTMTTLVQDNNNSNKSISNSTIGNYYNFYFVKVR